MHYISETKTNKVLANTISCKHRAVCGIVLFIFIFTLNIQSQHQNYLFTHLTAKQGLAPNVISALKDSSGFMWFATGSGLYRYDGINFKLYSYDPRDTTSISGNVLGLVSPIYYDSKGTLWIGTSANGLNKYHKETETFTRFKHQPDNPKSLGHNTVTCIYEDSKKVLWVGTPHGLNKFHPETGTFTRYIQSPKITNNNVDALQTIFEDSKGNLYIGSTDGLFLFNRENESFSLLDELSIIKEPFKNIAFRNIEETKNGILWMATNTGLIRYNPVTGKIKRYNAIPDDPDSLQDNDLYKLQIEPTSDEKIIWIGTTGGISKFDVEKEIFQNFKHDPTDPNSLNDNLSWSIYIDNSSLLWITNESFGVDILNLNRSPFRYYDIKVPSNSKQRYPATSFIQDNADNWWIGSFQGGLFRFNNKMELTDRYDFAPDKQKAYAVNFIRYVFQDSRNDIWAGTSGGGIFKYDPTNDTFRHIPVKTNDNRELVWVYRIFEDKQNTLWFTMNTGIYLQNINTDSVIPLSDISDDPLASIKPYCIAEDNRGNVWIGTNQEGLFLLTPENRKNMHFINFKHDPDNHKSINSDVVMSIHSAADGSLWIGTNFGLNKFIFEDSSFAKYDHKSGLDAMVIYHTEDDNNGNLWLSTEKGLICFNPSAPELSRTKVYELQDGLPFSGMYPFYFHKARDGKFFVGGAKSSSNGFYTFDPDSLTKNSLKPPIVITDFKINNSPVELDTSITEIKQIHLKHNENFFSFEFAALDFVNPKWNQYSYMLEGLDENWIYNGNRAFANYTGVPPGSYTFRVKGSDTYGIWNEEGAQVHIIITPPFWKTWWAYILYTFLFFAVIYGLRRYDLKRQQLKRDLEVEQLQIEKLEELDHMKSQFFANISHEFRTPLTLILGPLNKVMKKVKDHELKKDLGIMQRNASRLHNLINQLLSLSKLESGKMKLKAREENIVHLVYNFFQSFESMAKQDNINLKFNSNENNIFIYVDRNKIEKIINNLLSNSFKFTNAGGKIKVNVYNYIPGKKGTQELSIPKSIEPIDNDGVIIQVKDTGKGIPPERIDYVFDRFYQAHDDEPEYEGTGIGLALTKELVELHGGKIWVKSLPDPWTTFTIYIPCGKDHLESSDLSDGLPADEEDLNTLAPIKETGQEEMPVSDVEDADEEKTNNGLPIVLIVEDNRDMRSYIRGYLEDSYRVIEAEDGEVGLQEAISQVPDLIISDLMMPRMDGVEMCTQLKSDERTSHIPIIMLTAKAGSESKIEGLETGADAYLTKPFDAEELLVRIRKLIEQRRKLRERFAEKLGADLQLPSVDAGISAMDQKFLEKAREVVEQNLSDSDFSVEMFGKEMAMSRVQLHRKLTALINQSASRFIRTLRLKKAAKLLADQSSNVSGVAYDVGFNNLSWFAKCFQEQYGISPSDFTNRKHL